VRSRTSSLPDPDARWQPIAPDDVPAHCASWLASISGIVRVAVDGPPCARPADLAEALIEPLRALARPAVHVRAESFWRDASLRLEQGREDIESYLNWLDADALRREVLDPAVADGTYLPSLRNPTTNRSTREAPRRLAPGTMLLVSGQFLLGRGLPFDRTIHLAMSAGARERRTPVDEAWTLAADAEYDARVRPTEAAQFVVKVDDPRHPAVRHALERDG
jgi:hypothetical protein